MGSAAVEGVFSYRRGRFSAWPGWVLDLGVWLLGAGVFFRAQWESGFRNLMGNRGDTALIVYLLEHWFSVLHGGASWSNPAFFWPVKGVLGWSDGLVLFEVFYIPLRFVGCDPFLAAQLTVVAFSLVGFLSFVAVVRELFAPPRWLALAGGLVFSFANDLWVNVGRFQLLGIWIVPLVVLIALRALRAESMRRAAVLGAVFGVLEGLLFFTSYYVAWLCLPAALLALIVAVAVAPRRLFSVADRWIRRKWVVWAAAVAGFGLAIIPFLDVYLPAQRVVPHASYQLTLSVYAAHLHDVINVGKGNLLWGASLRDLVPSLRASGEVDYAATPILMVTAVIGSIAAIWLSRRRSGGISPRALAAVSAAASAVVLTFMPVSFHGRSMWIILWHAPGGSALRAIDRIGIVAGVMAIIAVVAAGAELWAAGRRARRRLLCAGVVAAVALVLVEQINTQVTSGLNRAQELSLLRSVPPAPGECRSFYLTDAALPTQFFFIFQLDAMLISQKVDLPTINGYTGYNPKGWNLEAPGPGYAVGVNEWSAAHHLSAVCQLNLADMTWTPMP